MDIYIVRKCRVEMRKLPGTNGVSHRVPVMTKEDIHSYVIKEPLTAWQREQIQKDLEDFYTRGQ